MTAETTKETAAKKRAKFRELAENRTNRALDAIRKVGNLSNRQLYDYDETEIKKIARALRDAISDVENKFAAKGRSGGKFKL